MMLCDHDRRNTEKGDTGGDCETSNHRANAMNRASLEAEKPKTMALSCARSYRRSRRRRFRRNRRLGLGAMRFGVACYLQLESDKSSKFQGRSIKTAERARK